MYHIFLVYPPVLSIHPTSSLSRKYVVIRLAKADHARTIEANLDSTSVTPRVARQELIRHVSQPKCAVLQYREGSDAGMSSGIRALAVAISHHVAHPTEIIIPGSTRYDSLRAEQRTLRKFYEKSQHIFVELGASAADYFIRGTIEFLRKKLYSLSDLELDISDSTVRNILTSLDSAQVEQACQQEATYFPHISDKVQCLLRYLLNDGTDDICGIVFVKQRIVASVLSTMLNDVTLTGGKMYSVPSVGSSGYSGKKYSITELLDKSKQKQALDTFRQGRTNIVVATSVLEEGIDVQACNVVACFDLPDNLKSYIQRRGRARQQHSRYGLLLDEDADEGCVYKWRQLEQDLVALCQEERRQAEYYRQLEEEDESPNYVLEVQATG
ncbi:hypothetical protein MRB53_037700 [Persea americana]|nr:hypothetical protein MRB53_037700 [Persea americana]